MTWLGDVLKDSEHLFDRTLDEGDNLELVHVPPRWR